jgi:hypothetical protein
VAHIVAQRLGTDPELVVRTLTGNLKTAPDGAIRKSDRYIVIGGDDANRPDPVQAAWAYAQIVRWGQAPLSAELRARAERVFRADVYDAALGPLPRTKSRPRESRYRHIRWPRVRCRQHRRLSVGLAQQAPAAAAANHRSLILRCTNIPQFAPDLGSESPATCRSLQSGLCLNRLTFLNILRFSSSWHAT